MTSAELQPPATGPATPKSASRPPAWIISPLWDLTLLVGSPLAIVPALLWLGDHWASPETISLAVLAFASAGHHLPGFLRAYGERDLFRRFRWRFLLAPPAALAVSLLFATQSLSGLALVMLLWATWHGLMQTYGFLRIYDLKRGLRDAWTARLDWALCLGLFAGGVLFSDARVAHLAETCWLAGGPALSAEALAAARTAGAVALAAVIVLYLVNAVRVWRTTGVVGWIKLALALTTGWLYWLGGALSTNVLIGVAMFEVFHALQYYAIVWVYNGRLARRLGQQGGWASLLFQNRIVFLALYLGVIAAWGLPFLLGGRLLADQALAIMTAVYTASAMLHFYYDGFIWKVREPDVQTNLGVAAAGKAPPRVPAASHLLKCLALAAGLGLLAWTELRTDGARASQPATVSLLTSIAPKLPEVQLRASQLALASGDVPAALAAARAAVDKRPRSHEAHYQLGRALLASGHPQPAAEALRQACRLAPRQWRNHLRLATALMELGDWRQARAELEQAERLAPRESDVHGAWGDFYYRRNDIGMARVHYQRAVELDQRSAEAWAALARAQELDDDPPAAEQSLRQAIAADPSKADLRLRMGELLRQQGDYAGAAEQYARAARLAPQSFAAWNNLGAMRLELGQADQAAEAWRRAISIDPEQGAAHYNLGLALREQGQDEQADASFAAAASRGFRAPPAP